MAQKKYEHPLVKFVGNKKVRTLWGRESAIFRQMMINERKGQLPKNGAIWCNGDVPLPG